VATLLRREGEEVTPESAELLKSALSAAVPLWIEKLKQEGTDSVDAGAIAETIAFKGDIIMYGSKKKGEAAAAFNELAKGLALLSFCPGGVTFAGLHFEAKMD